MSRAVGTGLLIVLAFAAGLFTHGLYQRWNPPASDAPPARVSLADSPGAATAVPGQAHRVTYMPLGEPAVQAEQAAEVPTISARDVEKIRALTGKPARVRGRVFRVGHSAKSNTYFLNFGPSREALTAVIFASALELFEKNQLGRRILRIKKLKSPDRLKTTRSTAWR